MEGLRHAYAGSPFSLTVDSFVLEPGKTAALIGPSGSGKTTFLHLLAGILLPLSGRVSVQGTDLARQTDAKRRAFRLNRIGLVFQEFELLDHLCVRENILLPYLASPTLQLDQMVEEDLRQLTRAAGIEASLERYPRALAQGERQRVAICRALISRPAVLLADEPTGNLDPESTRRILDLLLEQVTKRQTALCMVTHDHGLLKAFDQVLDFEQQARPGGQR